MLDEVKKLLVEVKTFLPKSKEEAESFRVSFLGKKGFLNSLFSRFKSLSGDEKKILGKEIKANIESNLLSLLHIDNGIYFINIKTDKGSLTKRIILSK